MHRTIHGCFPRARHRIANCSGLGGVYSGRFGDGQPLLAGELGPRSRPLAAASGRLDGCIQAADGVSYDGHCGLVIVGLRATNQSEQRSGIAAVVIGYCMAVVVLGAIG